MKKHIYIIMSLVMVLTFIPVDIYAYDFYGDFVDVKIKTKNINEEISLYSPQGFVLYDKGNKDLELMDIDNEEILIKFNGDGFIDILDIFGELITTISDDGSNIIGSRDTFESIIQVDKDRYRDYILFLINKDKIHIINHIDIEHYLYGVVPREIPASSPKEALKAQAVVARSYAYTSLNNHTNEGYNLCNTTHCQVYGGYDWEKPSTNEAVNETYGDYVSFNGDIVSTPYHSNSGGYTEDSGKVWGGSLPYLVGVEDIYSLNAPNSSWTVNITPRELKEKLLQSGIDVGEILNIEAMETTDSNRVKDVKIIGSKKEEIISGDKFRSIIGSTYLKSTLFSINKEGSQSTKRVYVIDGFSSIPKEISLRGIHIIDGYGNSTVNRSSVNRVTGEETSTSVDGTFTNAPTTFVLEGKGYGHGVGMSQYGAIEMAKQGFNYDDIIQHYYKGVEIINKGK